MNLNFNQIATRFSIHFLYLPDASKISYHFGIQQVIFFQAVPTAVHENSSFPSWKGTGT
jgi:hypothetical protein